jgi:hypothetical protein
MASRVADGRDGNAAGASSDGAGRAEQLADLVVALADENAHLQRALETRVVIEQAKGVLAERFDLDVHEAFRLLRVAARSNRIRLHDLAARIVESRQTPAEIEEVRLGRRRLGGADLQGMRASPARPSETTDRSAPGSRDR